MKLTILRSRAGKKLPALGRMRKQTLRHPLLHSQCWEDASGGHSAGRAWEPGKEPQQGVWKSHEIASSYHQRAVAEGLIQTVPPSPSSATERRSRKLSASGNAVCVVQDIFTLKCSGAWAGQGFTEEKISVIPLTRYTQDLYEKPGQPWYGWHTSGLVLIVLGLSTYQFPPSRC